MMRLPKKNFLKILKKNKKIYLFTLLFTSLLAAGYYYSQNIKASNNDLSEEKKLKLYWFIPDGLRAEPELFNIYQWAEEGKLPNIKRLMESGAYGYSQPPFPDHTPIAFATLMTGAYPDVHGINDGPMRSIGKPLDKVAVPGFRSVSKKATPIWSLLEKAGFKVAIASIPGSTPPEIQKGVVLRGRWGGWGADFHALNFETKGNLSQRIKQGRGSRLFYFGPQLTEYIDPIAPQNWQNAPASYSQPLEVGLKGWDGIVYAYIYDSTDDKKKNYDRVALSTNKKDIFSTLKEGDWSDWGAITLKWKAEDKSVEVNTKVKANLTKLENDGFYRIRLVYDTLNEYITQPENAAEVMEQFADPTVDFVDNFPAQLIYYPEDKQTFIDEANMSLDWHKKAVSSIVNNFSPDVVIHDVYTPNQMLTTRWWMGYVDPKSTRYNDVSSEEREKLWSEVQDMYKKIDDIVGEILKVADKDTYIVFTSDHGAAPLNRSVNINNLFAKKGWLKFKIDPKTGEPIIDWKNTKVIYLKFAHVYVNPNGLAGDYKRASGPEYEKLRKEVIDALAGLQDTNGVKPLADWAKWEDAKSHFHLDPDRTGDLVIANVAGYGWNEEMSAGMELFSTPLITGYKQSIVPGETNALMVPLMIAGPNIKKGQFMGEKPVEMVDEYATIMKALKQELPEFAQGKALDIFNK